MFDSPIQFEEADKAIAERLPADTALKYQDILRQWTPEARQRAFFSARVMDATVLSELKRRVQQVVSGEMTSDQATRLMQDFFRHGGRESLVRMGFLPSERGQGKGVSELASTARLRLIFETNTRMAQEVGHYKQWEAVKEAYPYGVWHCGYAEEHRPEHLARDGKAYPFDHSIWTHSPPGGEFNCHCWREPISAEEAALRGLIPEPMDSAFQPSSLGFDPSRGMDQPVQPGRRTDPELAEKAKVPPTPELLGEILPEPAAEPAPAPQSQPTVPPVPKVAIGGGGMLDGGRLEEGGKHGRLVTGEEIDRKTQELREAIEKQLVQQTTEITGNGVPIANASGNEGGSLFGTTRKTPEQIQENIEKFKLQPTQMAKLEVIDTPAEYMALAKQTGSLLCQILNKDIFVGTGKMFLTLKQGRNSREEFTKTGIEVNKRSGVLDVIHEIGHLIEHANPEIRKKCIAFLKERCKGYEEEKIYLAQKYPTAGYDLNEISIRDSFINDYVGKQYVEYINGKATIVQTEILSTGLRFLADNPASFKQKDLGHYQFVLSVLNLKDPLAEAIK